ncbi:SRPBCC domain-containing protein [Nocardia huaxiensis]|uniref:SRPBCC domain-containing protein n=1 Tax=Nocardia huaxiensis TaxID=2755382 RepID=A0A7D6V784_9NOCA|nr:SRPBCC domain-containing protein [Nocardia huaxiensis]QLY28434.1 SRPBCC domain-containing protein [Nocardia huaxiensis]UFS98117.1 SRPBCC domain-containing protein [Nocardia huaxiensis]
MREISTWIEIDASPDYVWQVLTDLDQYPRWNPFIVEAFGDLRAGSRLKLRMVPVHGKELTFEPEVLTADPCRELRWLNRLLLPGLFDSEHRFALTPLPGRRTRLEHSARFSGLFVWCTREAITNSGTAFARLNVALKQRAERMVRLQANR